MVLPVHSATRARLISSALLVLSMTSCAYHAGYGDRQIPGGYRSVAVPVFRNMTHEAGIEVFFTNAFIREMERSKIGRVTAQDDSQVTLEGVIDNVQFLPTASILGDGRDMPNGTVLNTEYRVVVATTLRLRRNADQKILWQSSFQKDQPYRAPQIGKACSKADPIDLTCGPGLTSANSLYNHSARYQRIEMIAADMMAEAHERLTENF